MPYSRRHPQFNRETLKESLQEICEQLNIREDLLRTPEELENEAYAAREEKMAYANPEHGRADVPPSPGKEGGTPSPPDLKSP